MKRCGILKRSSLPIKCIIGCFFVILQSVSFAQSTSTKGKDFWVGYGLHTDASSAQRMFLYITSDVNTTVTIEIPGLKYFPAPVQIEANIAETIEIPPSAYMQVEGIYKTGIHITSKDLINVYSHIYSPNYSGSTLVLPTESLGKEYISINYYNLRKTYFFIVATEDNTKVEITPSQNTHKNPPGVQPPDISTKPLHTDTTDTITLQKGQVYQALASGDFTGTKIRSVSVYGEPPKPIAVFSGNDQIYVTCNSFTGGISDVFYQQAYPTSVWGRKFITAPLAGRNFDVFRIIRSEVCATVKLNGTVIPESDFFQGMYYQFNSDKPNVIESDKPIQVVQYAVSHGGKADCTTSSSNDLGDADMIYLNAVEQSIKKTTVYNIEGQQISRHHINVILSTAAVSSFGLDGVTQNTIFKPVPEAPEYSYAQFTVSSGVHTLTADSGFNSITYGVGWQTFYGYSSGANLITRERLEVKSKADNKVITKICFNQPVRLKIILNYSTNKLVWDPGNGTTPVEVNNATPDSTYTLDGKTYYAYELAPDVIYTDPNHYTIKVKVQKGSISCGDTEEILFDFSVFAPPKPAFSSTTVCSGFETVFKDLSDGGGLPVTSWKWDFGDGTGSTISKPRHQYAREGTYQVTLTVTNEADCGISSITRPVTVITKPKADFISLGCGNEMTFTDRSENTPSKLTWDFGDGKTEVRTESTPFIHVYPSFGTYTVTLVIEASKGCTDTVTKEVITSPKPTVDFTLPEVCYTDAYAEFIDKSTFSDQSQTQISYLWNFGDSKAGPGNENTSAQINPRHKYSSPGNYTISLTITPQQGCPVTVSKVFQVNGDAKALFEVVDRTSLCGGRSVYFVNNSEVTYGKITKLEWIYDFANNPSAKVVDEDPEPGKVYQFVYPRFDSPKSKNFRVKLIAYSGVGCTSEMEQVITINSTATVILNLPDSICAGAGPVQIVASDSHGNPVDGTYIGPGVTSDGFFNPDAAGSGIHKVQYVFSGNGACKDTVTQNITVSKTPAPDLGKDLAVLSGAEVRLSAQVDESRATYKWSPSTGLDRDDVASPIASPSSDITYTVTVWSSEGCVGTDTIKITVVPLINEVIRNTFTPNNDGINDRWNIPYLDSYPACTIQIFNRLGVKVFSSTNNYTPWDGTFKGEPVPSGTYYYVIDPGNQTSRISGHVTIIR